MYTRLKPAQDKKRESSKSDQTPIQSPSSPVSEFNLSGSNTPPPQRTSPRDIATPSVIGLDITQLIVQFIPQPFVLPSTQVFQYQSSPTASQGAQASQYQSSTMVATRPNWLKGSPVAIAGQPNALPKNSGLYMPKYVHGSLVTAKEHVQRFRNVLSILRVEHEDVACALFPATFDEHAHHWFDTLPAGSITYWDQMEQAFVNQFRIPIQPILLYRQFAFITKGPQESISSFNDRFQRTYNKLVDPCKVSRECALDAYFGALDAMTSAFVRREPMVTILQAAYAKALKVEQQFNPQNGSNLNVGTQ